MTLEQWLKLHIPAIPQHIFDRLEPEEAAKLGRYGSIGNVTELLRRNISIERETWEREFQARRVLVSGTLAEPFGGFAPWHASKLGDRYAISKDGFEVRGIVRQAAGLYSRLTQRERKVADELFPLIAATGDGVGARRAYAKYTAPPTSERVYDADSEAVSAWWLDPLDHATNLAQMRNDAAGFAKLYTRTREHDEQIGLALEAVMLNYRRYVKLFELDIAEPCLDTKLVDRVTTKRALKKLQGGT